jgi:hypothetical protein
MTKIQDIVDYMEKIVTEEDVYLAVLYRIDGVPALVKMKSDAKDLVKGVILWMEREIKYVLPLISRENLEGIVHELSSYQVIFYPVSELMVLAVVAGEEVHRQKLMIDIASTKESIKSHLMR